MSNKFEGIREFRPDDVHALNLHSVFESGEHRRRERFIDSAKAGCPAYTICFPNTDNAMAVVSGRFIYDRVFRAFTLVDVEVEDFTIYYVKQLRKVIDRCFEIWSLVRMEVVMRADQAWCDKWAKLLRFEKEGVMKRYGDELCDYFLFARTV
jgi:hypothetical protein